MGELEMAHEADTSSRAATEPREMVEADVHVLSLLLSQQAPPCEGLGAPDPPRAHGHSSLLLHPPTPSPLPFMSAPTKSEQYGLRRRYDRCVLQRPRAHARRALSTTRPIEATHRRLRKSLHTIETSAGDHSIALERLSAFAAAFDELIETGGVFSPLLRSIKDAYDERTKSLLSQHGLSSLTQSSGREGEERGRERGRGRRAGGMRGDGGGSKVGKTGGSESLELFELRKKVHRLEVQSRVMLKENQRLKHELDSEIEMHRKEMADLEAPLEEPEPANNPSDYASKAEELQIQIAECHDAIAVAMAQRSGKVPVTVCHQLEQCIREVEIKIQRRQQQGERLKLSIQEAETELLQLLQEANTTQNAASLLWSHLQEGMS